MIGRRRDPDAVWPLRWLRNAALIFTFLNALVDFATEGFGALLNMSIGLFTLAVLSYQLDAREAGGGRRKNQSGGVTGFGGSSPARNSRTWPKPPSRHAS